VTPFFHNIPMRERLAQLLDIPSDVSPDGERMLAQYGIVPCNDLGAGWILLDGERRVAHCLVTADGWGSYIAGPNIDGPENIQLGALASERGLKVDTFKSLDGRGLYHAHGVVQ
jgi:hypothetical protein